MLTGLCGLALAIPLAAGATEPAPAPQPTAADLSGRWEGATYEMSRMKSECAGRNKGPCTLTLDVSRCGSGWCGVEVSGAERRCAATALKLDGGGRGEATTASVFKGNLSLAKGTEPYVVEVYLIAPVGDEPVPQLQIIGDTGGEFRMFRRSFPFSATLAKVGDAKCQPESTVSLSLD